MKILRALEVILGLVFAGVAAGMGLLAVLIGVLVLAGSDSIDAEPSLLHRLSGLLPVVMGSIVISVMVNLVRTIRAETAAKGLPRTEADRAASATSDRTEG